MAIAGTSGLRRNLVPLEVCNDPYIDHKRIGRKVQDLDRMR